MNRTTTIVFWFLRIALPCAAIYGAVVFHRHLLATAPQQQRKPPEERRVAVETQQVVRQNQVVTIRATGTVVPVEEVALRARVSGEAVAINPRFEPGDIIPAGEIIVRIDQADYLLALRQAESALIQAEFNYKVELGYQEVARHEWELLDSRDTVSELEKELTLRKPHLAKAKAGVDSAKTALEQAHLNLSRTALALPFDALVLSRAVSAGAQINTQSELGVLVDASLFRVEATVPFDRLSWIALPGAERPGASVEIFASGDLGGSVKWRGRVSKLAPEIETRGRMARILIDVENPLQGKVPLLLNSFVSMDIAGRELKDVFVVPSQAVHNGDIVYVVSDESRIAFRRINPIWRDAEWVLTRDGLEEGDLLITTEVPSAVPDMQVKKVEHSRQADGE